MIAFHGDPAIKEKYIARVRAHREADQLVQGYGYWKDGKGCAVGCTLHSSDHGVYESELGITRSIARLEDGIFESLSSELAMMWPERFLSAIATGSDLSMVTARFLWWLLVDPSDGVIKFARFERSRWAIQSVADLYARKIKGETVDIKEWRAAAYDAAYAAADAYTAAYDAAYAAADADAYTADAYAAYAAADADAAAAAAAYDAAYAAADAYTADAYAAYAAADADAAAYAAADVAYAISRSQARAKQADKLIELLEAA